MQPGAKKPVDNERNILWPGDICGVNGSTGVQPRITRGAGFFRQRFLALECQQRDGDAVGLRQARHHVAITTVIAMTAEDQPVLAGRVVGSRPLKSRFPGPHHQLKQRQAQTVRRRFFRAPQRICRPDEVWYTHRVFRHRMVHHVSAPRSQ